LIHVLHDRVIHYLPFFLSSFHLLQAEDVARAFDIILHRGEIGKMYNIGGTHEKTTLEVAPDLIRLMRENGGGGDGEGGKEEGGWITHVADRH